MRRKWKMWLGGYLPLPLVVSRNRTCGVPRLPIGRNRAPTMWCSTCDHPHRTPTELPGAADCILSPFMAILSMVLVVLDPVPAVPANRFLSRKFLLYDGFCMRKNAPEGGKKCCKYGANHYAPTAVLDCVTDEDSSTRTTGPSL